VAESPRRRHTMRRVSSHKQKRKKKQNNNHNNNDNSNNNGPIDRENPASGNYYGGIATPAVPRRGNY